MALLKTRPDVRLLLNQSLVAGEIGEYTVELNCPKPVAVRSVTLTLSGDVSWVHGGSSSNQFDRSRFMRHEVKLIDEPTELAAGPHRMRAKVRLPATVPPSWEGSSLRVHYRARVHVNIPWWLDARVDFAFPVGASTEAAASTASLDPAQTGPKVYATDTMGPTGTKSYLELSLGSQLLQAGDKLRATAALGNIAHNDYGQLRLTLIAEESIPVPLGGPARQDHTVARWGVELPENVGELQPIPFQLGLPDKLAPAFGIHGCSMRWIVQLSCAVPRGPDPSMRVPVFVDPRPSGDGDRPEDNERAMPLAVGSDRLRLVWESVARDTGFQHVEGELHGHVGPTKVLLRRDYSEGQPKVRGYLRFPELGIGLRTHSSRRHLLSEELVHRLGARETQQLEVVLAKIGPILQRASATRHRYDLLDAGDGSLSFGLRGPGSAATELRDFTQFLCAIAEEANTLVNELPTAGALRPFVEAWTASAQSLRGRLRLSDLRMTLERENTRVVVGCAIDDDAAPEGESAPLRSTFFFLYPGVTIASRYHLLWNSCTALPEHEWELGEIIAPPTWLPADAPPTVSLFIGEQLVRVFLPPGLPDPHLENERIEALFALARQIRGEQGPYR